MSESFFSFKFVWLSDFCRVAGEFRAWIRHLLWRGEWPYLMRITIFARLGSVEKSKRGTMTRTLHSSTDTCESPWAVVTLGTDYLILDADDWTLSTGRFERLRVIAWAPQASATPWTPLKQPSFLTILQMTNHRISSEWASWKCVEKQLAWAPSRAWIKIHFDFCVKIYTFISS